MYRLPSVYSMPRIVFDRISARVSAHIPPGAGWPAAADDAYRYFPNEGPPEFCFAIHCQPNWLAYATFTTAVALLAEHTDTEPPSGELEALVIELSARLRVWVSGRAGVTAFWPTLTVADTQPS